MGFGLKKYDIEGKTARYEMPMLDDAVLIVRPATEVNKEYFNKVIKRSHRHLKKIKRTGADPKMLEDNRNVDRELYPLHVIADWHHVTDEGGNLVPFSIEECQAFVAEMPDWLFDDLREFASDIENFINLMDTEEKAKN